MLAGILRRVFVSINRAHDCASGPTAEAYVVAQSNFLAILILHMASPLLVHVASFRSIRLFLMVPNPVALPTLFKVSGIFLMARRTYPDGERILLRGFTPSTYSFVKGEYDEARQQQDEHSIWTGIDNPVRSKLWRICEPNRSARV
jgi:hypothetical protein